MNAHEWWRVVQHPYQNSRSTQQTHGHLRQTQIRVSPFSSFAVPFNWMLRESQARIDEEIADTLPPDQEPPFYSPWVFGRERQEALCELFFSRLTPGSSLVSFYTKSGHPLGETIGRLVVGVGTITTIAPLQWYDSTGPFSYPLWDRQFGHSIRPTGHDGFLLPYHDYLTPTDDPAEDERRASLLREIAVVPDSSDIMSFSYAGALSTADVTLSTLVQCLEAVRKIRAHGVAPGPWQQREEWLNAQIARAWTDRGAFPGTGAALEAFGMRLGTSLFLELCAGGAVRSGDNPWPILDAILRGTQPPPQQAYAADLKAVRATWVQLSAERRSLLTLLSRINLSPRQATRWFNPIERQKSSRTSVDDAAILANPYRIVELDLGDEREQPVSMGVVDRGLMPDVTIAARHPVDEPSAVGSPSDWRRVRGALVTVLRRAAADGDALLSQPEALGRLGSLNLAHPCVVSSDWLAGNEGPLAEEIRVLSVIAGEPTDARLPCLQLDEIERREAKLSSLLSRRSEKGIPSPDEDWERLIVESITEGGGSVDAHSPRHRQALAEQAAALKTVTSRRLTALVGRAGTGKTTVLGALLKSKQLANSGILFLAPTGKARVRLTQKTNQTAMTVAQFLNQLGRYDGLRQRPLFVGASTYRKETTVVIDECSMLTLDDLYAVLSALDLGHVQRIILVGDPNQLPPIGVGRPFADLVAHLDSLREKNDANGQALARLTVELRTAAGAPSDSLRLASWYTRELQPVDADRVLSDLELGAALNDLSVVFWQSPGELRQRLDEQMVAQLGLVGPTDVKGFNAALGLTPEGWVPFADHDGAERFQILSPVRLHPYGVYDLNRLLQRRFRAEQLRVVQERGGLSLGDEQIVWGDKVILVRNGTQKGWDGAAKEPVSEYLANGEIGVAAPASGEARKKFLNVAFAGRPDVRFGFSARGFRDGAAPLELAYALTVHKSQGSEFGTVFVVLPKHCRLMSRELLYTALTRAKRHMVLFVEGTDASFLYDLTRPERSETARRNSNLFSAGVRRELDGVPYAEHLIHRTSRGEMVRSKSELVIANHLFRTGLNYAYERPLDGTQAPGRLRPDFSFVDDAGDIIIWEHLGMMQRDDYRRAWEWKKTWYEKNGWFEGTNLFTTSEVEGLDMVAVSDVTTRIQETLGV
ncbi:MAG TPA: ATP-dependent RecD-like DNA helicase [Gemmatimonadaceae bacterium]